MFYGHPHSYYQGSQDGASSSYGGGYDRDYPEVLLQLQSGEQYELYYQEQEQLPKQEGQPKPCLFTFVLALETFYERNYYDHQKDMLIVLFEH